MNEFTVTGRLNFIDIKFLESGKVYTRVLISEKQRDGNFVSYPITLFNTQSKSTAEDIVEKCTKGDYVRISGKLNINKFTDKYGQKRENIELIGFEFSKVIWSETERKYIDVYEENCVDNEKFSTIEKTNYDNEEALIQKTMGDTPVQTITKTFEY